MARTLDDVRLRDLCEQACAKHTAIEDAVAAVMKMLDGHPDVRERLLHGIVVCAVRETIYHVRHSNRCEVKANPPRTEGIAAIGRIIADAMLDSWLIGDKRLGDVLGSDLTAEAQRETELAVGHNQNARFYGLLSERTPTDEVVRDHVTNDEARSLWAQAVGQSAADNHTSGARRNLIKSNGAARPFLNGQPNSRSRAASPNPKRGARARVAASPTLRPPATAPSTKGAKR